MTPSTHSPTCPRCFTQLGSAEICPTCQLEFVVLGGLLDHLGPTERETRAADVESFYTKSPFPGYAPGDDGPALLDRCRKAPFLVSIDAAVPPTARVLDAGCGTAQIPAFLALAGPRRQVFGVDGCKMSLTHAEEFRARAGVDNLQLVRADLFDLPIEKESFDFVLSRGVVHHTPDPDGAIARVASCVAPGGVLVLGFYETMGRAFHSFRRRLGRLRGGKPFVALDPILRRRDLDDEKKRIWIEDQYLHPLERILPLPHVLDVLREEGFQWVRTVPPVASGASLFDPTPEPSALGLFSLRAGWMMRGLSDPDAGLICVVARKKG
jgi:SAM-dependent methyltransferase